MTINDILKMQGTSRGIHDKIGKYSTNLLAQLKKIACHVNLPAIQLKNISCQLTDKRIWILK